MTIRFETFAPARDAKVTKNHSKMLLGSILRNADIASHWRASQNKDALLLKKFVGADGVPAEPDATLPEDFVWNDFGIVMRSEGNFMAGENPDILIGFNSSVSDAGGGKVSRNPGDTSVSQAATWRVAA